LDGSDLKEHLLGLLNYFVHPITNAPTERFNSRIQAIKADACGIRRFANTASGSSSSAAN